jgi:anti-anti-sigma regulatory factor
MIVARSTGVAINTERIVPAGTARHGDHLCCAFDSPAQQEELVIDFVRAGLEQDDRVWYFADANEPPYVLDLLRDAGMNVDRALDCGQLSVFTAESSYLTDLPFSPERMLASVHQAVDDALAAGYNGVHFLGEMDWATRAVPGAERLEEWERLIEGFYAERPVTGLCQFSASRFDQRRLQGLVDLHPKIARLPAVSEDGLLRVTDAGADEEGVPWIRVTGEGDVSSMAVLKQVLAALRGSGTDVHIDASRLQFMDLSGARCLIDTAAELGPERRVVLHQPRRAVRRLFEILAEHGDAVELVA